MNKDLLFSTMRTMVLGMSVSALIIGCSSESTDDVSPTDAPEAFESTETASTDTASTVTESAGGVMGKVSFSGTAPERTVIETEGDPNCAAMHGGEPVLSDSVLVSADGGLANVFVYVTNAPEATETPVSPVVLDQVGCMYTPHVLGVQVGQPLEIRNSDATTHNVRGVARKNKAMNYGQPAGSNPRTKTFKKEEMKIRMKCDIHPWMTAYVFAMGNSFFGVSDESGAFNIQGLPAGEYEVTAWHETFGEQAGKVTVGADGSGKVDFTFSG
jgi:plastocyanin